ncbi:MBL fold metallo-hydrolase [Tumebacillus sp. ITR2]|uniref:MBL fold metallo-hydrolase n=1 Tax=Tumebacillus amylolyticus TaxID=2801339 RepID=A0ABS1JFP6_9BACL|nr:MBL fold metallo-hydrolase [Tumebacillus amylolyticus]MBL0389108.1 MBL fold metallo-hydrolase [Tumebacillus amylolyticus]
MTVQTIQAKDLHQKINAGVSMLLLDVRTSADYLNWKIEGQHLQSVNIPYADFLADHEKAAANLPRDTEIVIICNKGNSARLVAEQLDEAGFHVSYLVEGMLAWSQFYHQVTVHEDQDMKLIQLNRLGKGCLSYMVISGNEALVVDAGRHVHEYKQLAESQNVRIRHVLDTHLHADHISGGHELALATGAKYYISSSELQGSSSLQYEALEQHATLHIGTVEAKVLAIPTPGHTPGSTSVLVNDRFLLSGDTIFVGGLGRPDLGGKAREWAQSLYDTVFNQIANLSDEIVVLPTHFADLKEINEQGYVGATLGAIRASNEVMRTADRDAFTEKVAGASGATPPNYEQIVGINRGEIHVTTEVATDLEIGPNRCAVHHS